MTAGNPVASIANGPVLADAMRGLECTVAIDIYMSETAALADYFLPAATSLEREDFPVFHVNLLTEPYSQWTEALIPKLGEAKEEWEIFTLLGDALGLTYLANPVAHWLRRALNAVGKDFSPRWILDGMIRTGPMGDWYLPWSKGWNIARLATHPHGVRLGELRTGILGEKLLTADKRIHFHSDDIAREAERLRTETLHADGEFPLRLVGRRDNRSNNSWLRNVPHLMRGDRDRRLRMHPDDAARFDVTDGEVARVRSRVGSVEAEVKITDEIMPGSAFRRLERRRRNASARRGGARPGPELQRAHRRAGRRSAVGDGVAERLSGAGREDPGFGESGGLSGRGAGARCGRAASMPAARDTAARTLRCAHFERRALRYQVCPEPRGQPSWRPTAS